MAAPDISIITPWLDQPQFIADYEEAVGAPGVQVIVIDNGSARANAEALGQMTARLEGRYIRNEENRWFGPANNQGLAQAQGRIVVFLNNDIAADPAWLDRVRSEVKPGALYGPSVVRSQDQSRPIAYLEGWCLAGDRDEIRRLGGFDADAYPMPYWEDADLCMRAIVSGMRLVPVNWELKHKRNGTTNFRFALKYAIDRNGAMFLARLHGTPPPAPERPLKTPADFLQAARLTEGEVLFRNAAAQEPRRADLWLAYGQILRMSGRPEASEQALRKAIALQPSLADAQVTLGKLLIESGRAGEAIAPFQQATELLPAWPDGFVNLSFALFCDGQYASADDAARRALYLNPSGLAAHAALSNALRQSGQADEALAVAQHLRELHPHDPAGYLVLGRALAALGRLSEARAALEQAIELNPNDAETKTALREIDNQIDSKAI